MGKVRKLSENDKFLGRFDFGNVNILKDYPQGTQIRDVLENRNLQYLFITTKEQSMPNLSQLHINKF